MLGAPHIAVGGGIFCSYVRVTADRCHTADRLHAEALRERSSGLLKPWHWFQMTNAGRTL